MSVGVPLWRRPRARLYAVVALVWLVVVGVLLLAWRVLLPFVIAALAAYVIDPIIAALSRVRVGPRRLPRAAAVLVVYAILATLLWLFAVSVVPQIYREAVRGLSELRDLAAGLTPERIATWAGDIDAFLRRYGIPLDVGPSEGPQPGRVSVDLAAAFADAIQGLSAAAKSHLGDVLALSRAVVTTALQILFFVVLLLMITAFLSMDAPRILAYAESLFPLAWRRDFRTVVAGVDAGLSGVVRGQITIMAINGALTLVGLLVLRIPFPFALGALATVLYVVPIFGTILSSIPIVLLAASHGISRGVLALLWILGIHALETYVLNPKIMGDASRIHPVLIVLALVIGEQYYGIVGALLAVPVASVVAAVFKFLHRRAVEMDEELARASLAPPQPPAA